jgi:Holliday junction resolvase
MKSTRDIGNELEEIIANKIRVIDPKCRKSRASGATYDIGDISNQYFYIECKLRNKKNLIISKQVWQHLVNQIPINSSKLPILVQQNDENKIFVTMLLDDWFNLMKKLKENNLL